MAYIKAKSLLVRTSGCALPFVLKQIIGWTRHSYCLKQHAAFQRKGFGIILIN